MPGIDDEPGGPLSELVERAFVQLEAEDLAAARRGFDEVLQRDPTLGRAWFGRGRVLHKQGEFEKALDDLDRALKHGCATAETYRFRGRCHDKLRVFEQIADDFSAVLEQLPGDPEALYERGNALQNLGETELALADYDAALAVGVDSALAYFLRAQVLQDLGETERAAADLERALGRGDDELPDADWCHSLAHFWERHEKHETAHHFFAAAARKEPDCERHFNCWANLLFQLDREDEAEEKLAEIERIKLQEDPSMADTTLIYPMVQEHFAEAPLDRIDVTVRKWPFRAAADLQRGFDSLESAGFRISKFHATQQGHQSAQQFTQVYQRDRRNPVIAVPPKYEELDIGEAEPVRALKDGLWLLHSGEVPIAVLLFPDYTHINVHVAAPNGPEGIRATHAFFSHLEETIRRSPCYRGKVLSLEHREMYSGQGLGLLVHKIRKVSRDEVILPQRTVDLLDRNVRQFVLQRHRLASLGLSTKKGLLFYGPPGTGKTHTLHFLADSMTGQTMFLISAEQVGNLDDYITLARLLQPSMVVIEDVDLIARERGDLRSSGEEVLLNKLLNEMDGLRQDAEIIFALTTNRPESLEEALTSRPGRIDQAIEFPLPEPDGRARLVRLYSQGVPLAEDVVRLAVAQTENVSASFIKELMRRSIQFALCRTEGEPSISAEDIQQALEELLVAGGSLNRKLLGAERRVGFN